MAKVSRPSPTFTAQWGVYSGSETHTCSAVNRTQKAQQNVRACRLTATTRRLRAPPPIRLVPSPQPYQLAPLSLPTGSSLGLRRHRRENSRKILIRLHLLLKQALQNNWVILINWVSLRVRYTFSFPVLHTPKVMATDFTLVEF